MKKFKTESVHNAHLLPKDLEQRIIDPPRIVYGYPSIPKSQSIIMNIGELRQILEDWEDKDSLRIKWFAEAKEIEYSIVPKN